MWTLESMGSRFADMERREGKRMRCRGGGERGEGKERTEVRRSDMGEGGRGGLPEEEQWTGAELRAP